MESDRILNNPKEKLFLPESLSTDLAKLVNTLGSTARVSLLAERGLDDQKDRIWHRSYNSAETHDVYISDVVWTQYPREDVELMEN